MNFFAAQDQARQATRRLVIAYSVATLLIVGGVAAIVGVALFAFTDAGYKYTTQAFLANTWPLLAGVAAVTAAVIFGASLFKTAALSSGGGRVAAQMGGTLVPADVQDPLRRRLRNVVEEMAIASGVPVPEIYVLEEESGINAFAAGYAPSDAAVAVTRGTLELLDRDELQGVIAHEFSHILNGDMRLNIRLMGVLFGIMVIALAGRIAMRGGYHANLFSSSRNRNAPVVLAIGIGLVILGSIGIFCARVIKAGVSRQREFLADASAVQFTRQSRGIANALKKIGGYSEGSMIQSADPEEVSHMLFGTGSKLSGLFATHPPLAERIQALDPSFRESDFPRVDPRRVMAQVAPDSASAAFAGATPVAADAGELAEAIAVTVGQPANQHVEYAQALRRSIPESLYSAAHSTELALLLTVALVMHRSGPMLDRQLALVREQLGNERFTLVRRYHEELEAIGPEYRLPLLEIGFPALKRRPRQELSYLVSLASRLIEVDGEIDLFEYCFYRILVSSLEQAADPGGRRKRVRTQRGELQTSAMGLLALLAQHGHGDERDREAAFASGVATLGPWAQQYDFVADAENSVARLDHNLDVLLALNRKGKESLLRAISATAGYDGRLSVAEAELIRTVCATLDYPLPPILVQN